MTYKAHQSLSFLVLLFVAFSALHFAITQVALTIVAFVTWDAEYAYRTWFGIRLCLGLGFGLALYVWIDMVVDDSGKDRKAGE